MRAERPGERHVHTVLKGASLRNMGLFNFLKGTDTAAEITFPATLGAASKGHVIPMEEIPDPVFSIGAVGLC